MTHFAIIRTKKHKSLASIIGVARHHAREVPCPSADISMASKNRAWGAGKSPSQAVGDKVKQVIENAQKKAGKKFRSDSVKAVEYLLTASPDWWKTAKLDAKNKFIRDARAWLEAKHGAGCVVAEWLHMDEHSPHLHAIVVPLVGGVLNAKAFFGGKTKMRSLQDDFAKKVGEPVGLSRGVRGSNAEHVKAVDWWAALEAPTPSPTKMDFAKAAVGLDVPSITLQEKKAKLSEVLQTTAKKTANRTKLISESYQNLQIDKGLLAERERMLNAKDARYMQLEKDNLALREQLARLAPGAIRPGHNLGGLGL